MNRLYGLIGFPLGHSFSARYFTEKFQRENLSGYEYRNFPLESIRELPAMLENHPGLLGFNVTIPYKQEVILIDIVAEDLGTLTPDVTELMEHPRARCCVPNRRACRGPSIRA